nr:neuroblastoma breakpoint family member 6-like protein [Vicugna pacos]
MAASLTSFSGSRTEMSILEINQNLRCQLEKVKQDFRDLTEKFLTSKATVYSLANQLQKYSKPYGVIVTKVINDCPSSLQETKYPPDFILLSLPSKTNLIVLLESISAKSPIIYHSLHSFLNFTFPAHLRKYDPLIQAQAQELTHLRQKIQEGKGACYLFTQHARNTVKSFESLLRSTGIAYYQRQRFCELLTQGSQLAERLASQLTTEDHQDREGEDGQEPLAPSFSRGLQAEEENEVQEDSLDEMYLTHSSYQDSHQPPNTSAFACDGQEASSAVDVAGLAVAVPGVSRALASEADVEPGASGTLGCPSAFGIARSTSPPDQQAASTPLLRFSEALERAPRS